MASLNSTERVPNEKVGKSRRGYFIVVDGLDGIGKGVIERALDEFEQRQGKATFDSIAFSRAHTKGLPELIDFWNPPHVHYHTIITAEPTYAGIGRTIRQELISKSVRSYKPATLIPAYSVDREISMKRVVIPALENGLNVIQGRCVASTLCYQGQASGLAPEGLTKFAGELAKYEGNRMQLSEWAPDLLIIPTITNVAQLIERIKARMANQKDDNSIFDNAEFQGKIKPFYESNELKALFERNGTRVAHLDASISLDHTASEAVRIYKEFLGSKK